MNRTALLEKLTKLHTEAEELRRPFEGTDKSMPGDVVERWEKILDDADATSAELKAFDRQSKLDASLKEVTPLVAPSLMGGGGEGPDMKSIDAAAMATFRKFLSNERVSNEDLIALAKGTVQAKKGLQVNEPIQGGFAVVPEVFASSFIQALDAQTVMRSICTVLPAVINAESLGVVSLDADLDDFDWTTEVKAATEDDLTYAKRELQPHPATKLIKISRKHLRAAAFNPEALVMQRLAYKAARTQDKGFVTGNGVRKPLGVFTASSDGISTDQDVATAGASLAADDIIDLVHQLGSGYLPRARFLLHRLWLGRIRKLKDTNGNYVWTPFDGPGRAITDANPGLIMGHPYTLTEDAPTATTSGSYICVFGDFSYYWIVDALTLTIQTLLELYAVTNQNGYIARFEADGMPVLEDAFKRLKVQ